MRFIVAKVAKYLAGATWFRYVAVALFVVAFLYGVYIKGYWNGEADTEQRYLILIEQERVRIEEANRLALDEALRREKELISRLEMRDAILRESMEEAAQDPDADRPAIGVDSVRRLNRID